MREFPDVCQEKVLLERSKLINFRYVGNGVMEEFYLVTQFVSARYLDHASIPVNGVDPITDDDVLIDLRYADNPSPKRLAKVIGKMIDDDIEFHLITEDV